jgi:uncharacterized protein
MKRIALLLVIALGAPFAARADEASHRAKAEEMMMILHTDRLVQNISDAMKKQIDEAAGSITGPTPSADQKAKALDFENHAGQLIDSALNWDAMKPTFIEIYAKNFTEEQLDGILAFYKTPAGTALLANMPAVNTSVQQFGNSHLATLQPQLKELFDNFRKEQAAAPPTLGPPSTTPPASPAAKPSSKPK